MEFRILGSLEVVREASALPSLPYKPRALLAMLLLHRGEAVSLDRLADDLWGEQPPATAAKSVQIYVSQLRKALGEGVLETRGRGYALAVDADQVDAARFERMLQRGIDELGRGRAREAAAVLAEALTLWRGPALADFAYEPWAQAEIARLDALRLAALEERIDADLALGRHGTLIAELEGLIKTHPTRERLSGQLMLALYRSGRQADALAVFRERRRRIVDELGIEPGPALRELEAAILRQDPSLDPPARRSPPLLPRRRSGLRLVALGGAALLAAGVVAGAVALGGDEHERAAASAAVKALPDSICTPMAYQPGTRPTRLVISDQELAGDNRVLGSQITAAIEFVLRERRFTAGAHQLAFQACDSQTVDSEGRKVCGRRAKRYAANPAVLGVVGPLSSACATGVIPAANEAPAGPLAVVSPSNTSVSLTRRGPDAQPSKLQGLYPTGVRNYVRVIAADDFQVAAGAMLARQLGVRRPVAIFDSEINEANARAFRSAAEKLGLDVARVLDWRAGDPEPRLRSLKRDGVDGVYYTGADPDVVDGMRTTLGPDVPILMTDAYSGQGIAASEGLRFTVPGVDPDGVTGEGRELIDRLREAVGEPHPYTVSAVQATELLLDAIARSDGTRRSVISELFASEVRGGVLGDFSVTPTGDTTANQVTVYRIEKGERRFDRILNPPLSLVASSG
jgi:DNA-binding SARP family transcriptional activator/ABC-type branched-subunit amino acid transport system substrate-binding protein